MTKIICDNEGVVIFYNDCRPSPREIREKIQAFETLHECEANVVIFGTFFDVPTRLDVYCEFGARLVSVGTKYIVVKNRDGQYTVDPKEGEGEPEWYSGLYRMELRKKKEL